MSIEDGRAIIIVVHDILTLAVVPCAGGATVVGSFGYISGSDNDNFPASQNCHWVIQSDTIVTNMLIRFENMPTQNLNDIVCGYNGICE